MKTKLIFYLLLLIKLTLAVEDYAVCASDGECNSGSVCCKATKGPVAISTFLCAIPGVTRVPIGTTLYGNYDLNCKV